jgi:LmbE family N-acetylglucosaminyl deacetylase
MMRSGDVHDQLRSLPLRDVDQIAPGTSLILAPHPDDESLGCGGLIAALCDCGRPPVVVSVTDGTGSHPGSAEYPPARLSALREDELRCAAGILGVDSRRVIFLGIPDSRAPQDGACFAGLVAQIADIVRNHKVTTIFATWKFDPHCDHEASAMIAAAVGRTTGAAVRYYPVWGWLRPADEVLPISAVTGCRLAIQEQLPRKRQAIAAHASQYTSLITDGTTAFQLPSELLAVADQPFEVFLDA